MAIHPSIHAISTRHASHASNTGPLPMCGGGAARGWIRAVPSAQQQQQIYIYEQNML